MKYIYLIALLLALGCHQSQDVVAFIDGIPVKDVSSYRLIFDNQVGNSYNSEVAKNVLREQLIPQWEMATTHSFDSSEVIVIPMNTKEVQIVDNNVPRDRYLFFGKVNRFGYPLLSIIALDTKDKISNTKKARMIYEHNSGVVPHFTGRINILDLNYNLIEYGDYVNGKQVKTRILTTSTKQGRKLSSKAVESKKSCVEWYIVTRVNGIIVSEAYIGTTCDCQQLSITPGARMNGCNFGGGGGGGGPSGPPGKGVLATYTIPCLFTQNMWYRSSSSSAGNEYYGVVTASGDYLVTQPITGLSGPVYGIANDPGTNQTVYYWPVTAANRNANAPVLAGVRIIVDEGVPHYAVPIVAVVHTHPCYNDPNCLLHSSMSDQDIKAAQTYPNLRHWVINDTFAAQFDENGRFNLSPCASVQ